MTKKKRKIPEVLWRVYSNRARTLADAIVSLLPQAPSSSMECRCKGRGCLGCSGEGALRFLLRRDDPSEYRKLLIDCFVVISENAPPIKVFYPECRWSQLQIVRRTVEMIMCDSRMCNNTICYGYNKFTQSSRVVDLLTTSAWSLLLARIGDDIMVHLLKFASIFLPLPCGNHHQVAGFVISSLCSQSSEHVSETAYKQSLSVQSGPTKKRKLTDNEDKTESGIVSAMRSSSLLGSRNTSGSITCQLHCQQEGKHSQKSLSGGVILNTCSTIDRHKEKSNGELQQGEGMVQAKSKRHSRLFSWQRRRKRLRANLAEHTVSKIGIDGKENIAGNLKENSTTSLSNINGKELSRLDSVTQHALNIHSEKMSLQCCCYLMLQASEQVAREAEINRKFMFYNSNLCSSPFPRNHILNTLKPNNSGALHLMKDIFGLSDGALITESIPCLRSCHTCLVGYACPCHPLLQLLKSLIRRTRGCQHMKLLNKHCAVPELPKRTLSACDDLIELSGSYCRQSQVVSFIWAMCRSIVPPDFLGAPNWRALRRNISKFVRLRRFEKFSQNQCLHGLKTSAFQLLLSRHSSCRYSTHVVEGMDKVGNAKDIVKDKLFERWIYWFFSRLVVPLLQANFYITETEFGRLDVYYYRKQVWENLTCKAVSSLREGNYSVLDDRLLRNILRKRSFGFSKVRLCPKKNGVRVLAKLQARSKLPVYSKIPHQGLSSEGRFTRMQKKVKEYYYFEPVNLVLRDLSTVLKGIKMNYPEKLGSSVFDYNDVYEKLTPFLIGLKDRYKTIPKIYIAICDVARAFDSVNQDTLLMVMEDVMLNDEYSINKSSHVICTRKSTWIHYDQIMLDPKFAITKFTPSVPFVSLHSVFTNQETSRKIRKDELCRILREHVKKNVLQLGKTFYLQKVGIPQGSVLSSLLCSFYYAHMEANVLFPFLENIRRIHSSEATDGNLSDTCPHFDTAEYGVEDHISNSSDYMLLRFTDDFLFVSTSKDLAASFFSRLHRGFREYNCTINEAKSSMNFDTGEIPGYSTNKAYTGEDGISFLPWSGLLINCSTFEIQADYTRYLGIHMSSTITVTWKCKPGRHLKERLCHYIRPKCHPIFYDSNINSEAVVRLNIYQTFLLAAMKFHCYFHDFSSIATLEAQYCFEMIRSSLRYMHKLIFKRMKTLGSDVRPILKLKRNEVIWLGLKAYIRVLKRKEARYHRDLLSLLRLDLLSTGISESTSLKYAVEDSHSSIFWKLKY